MTEINKCMTEEDVKLVMKNAEKFEILRQKKSAKLINWEKNIGLIIVPVTINICVNSKKYKIDFIKYAKHMVDVLNDGFSGKSKSPYKNSNNETNFLYSIDYIQKILDLEKNVSSEKNAKLIYNFINKKTDTNIRFYLDSIVYHDTFIEEFYEKKDTETFIESISKKGFKVLDKHYKHLNINIIKFTCSTLGVSIFPWMKYVSNKVSGCMQVFLDFCTIHSDVANNKFNSCKTLIHEVGHIFGLRHTFSNNTDTLQLYSVLLGTIINQKGILDKINLSNKKDLKYLKDLKKINKHTTESTVNKETLSKETVEEAIDKNDLIFIKDKLTQNKINSQLYPDIPTQTISTNYNPFETKKFPFYNGIPNNFACFMDYSPDDVLTHFTDSQSLIMHYMIRMFKPYLIKKTPIEKDNLNNCKVKLYVHTESKIKNTFLNSILGDNSSKKCYINYDTKNSFKYVMSNYEEKMLKLVYRDK
jgi:hypothetical protein